jgi:hypothetical protein
MGISEPEVIFVQVLQALNPSANSTNFFFGPQLTNFAPLCRKTGMLHKTV